MKILAIGDVTSVGGVKHLEDVLWKIRKEEKIDFCIVNAENASLISGATRELAERLLMAGADCLTGGNHTLRCRSVFSFLDESQNMLRPINYGDSAPGQGYTILDCMGYRLLIINAMGNVMIDPILDSPFPYIDRLLEREAGRYDLAILDLHAEATGEKLAVAHAYDGKINIIFGTHTHVPTADEQVLPLGTGYISDIGMCGESGGILGMNRELIIARMRSHIPHKYEPATGEPVANGAIFELNPSTGRVSSVRRISF